jgi:hypothetical protein
VITPLLVLRQAHAAGLSPTTERQRRRNNADLPAITISGCWCGSPHMPSATPTTVTNDPLKQAVERLTKQREDKEMLSAEVKVCC